MEICMEPPWMAEMVYAGAAQFSSCRRQSAAGGAWRHCMSFKDLPMEPTQTRILSWITKEIFLARAAGGAWPARIRPDAARSSNSRREQWEHGTKGCSI